MMCAVGHRVMALTPLVMFVVLHCPRQQPSPMLPYSRLYISWHCHEHWAATRGMVNPSLLTRGGAALAVALVLGDNMHDDMDLLLACVEVLVSW